MQESRRIAKNEGKIEAAVSIIEDMKISVNEAMRVLSLPAQEKKNVIEALKKRNILYVM